MRGRVLGFDDGKGAIVASDGARFSFEIGNWRDKYPPARGLGVDFVPRDDTADEIYLSLDPESPARMSIYDVPQSPAPGTEMSATVAGFDWPSGDDGADTRPAAIVLFEQFAYASLGLDTFLFLLFLGQQGPGLSSYDRNFNSALLLLSVAIYALLAGLIHATARRGSNIAKWIYVIIFALNVVFIILTFAAPPDSLFYVPPGGPWLNQWLSGFSMLLTAVSICYLFTREAGDWFYLKQHGSDG